MPFRCHPAAARRATFTPFGGLEVLGGIIEALDNKPAACSPPTARPDFDVYETSEEYVLEGEVPGVSDKKSIAIEFTDAQTLAIKGTIRRPFKKQPREETNSDIEKLQAADIKSDVEMTDNVTSQGDLIEGLVEKPSTPAPSYRASVEDDVDEDDNKSDFEVINTPRTGTPAPTAVDEKKKQKEAEQEAASTAPTQEAPKDTARRQCENNARCGNGRKYWVTERSVGNFNRSFTFSGLVDQEAVKATLENGLLTVRIPKRKPYVRQVNIE